MSITCKVKVVPCDGPGSSPVSQRPTLLAGINIAACSYVGSTLHRQAPHT